MDVVLVHSGVTDAREWDGVRALLEPTYRTVTATLWQSRPLVDIVLEAIPGERAALVGTSFGGRAVLEAAASAPERAEAVVAIGTNPLDWSDVVQAVGAEEEALYDEGRLDDAAEAMVRAWLVGPHRSDDDVPSELRELVFAMQPTLERPDEVARLIREFLEA
jgi:3-oxoadipate enol-lactonase